MSDSEATRLRYVAALVNVLNKALDEVDYLRIVFGGSKMQWSAVPEKYVIQDLLIAIMHFIAYRLAGFVGLSQPASLERALVAMNSAMARARQAPVTHYEFKIRLDEGWYKMYRLTVPEGIEVTEYATAMLMRPNTNVVSFEFVGVVLKEESSLPPERL